jgi:hypothetical protein
MFRKAHVSLAKAGGGGGCAEFNFFQNQDKTNFFQKQKISLKHDNVILK